MSPFQRQLDKARQKIYRMVRRLRIERGFTQAELATMLDISQSRLSEIERGEGSFTAEQFLAVSRIFNVPLNHFDAAPAAIEDDIQNALASLGADHLRESADVLPSERLRLVLTAVRETLVSADSPRQLTALAPVLVNNIDSLNLWRLAVEFGEMGLRGRLGWLLESVWDALRSELARPLPRSLKPRYVKAEASLGTVLNSYQPTQSDGQVMEDVLDKDIRSERARQEVRAERSQIAKRWGLLTRLSEKDFVEALRAAHATR